jgi:hypothetical protein
MELQQLKYFCEVAKREHVTRTAEKLFVSQSAISRAVTHNWRGNWEFHSSIARDALSCCRLMGAYFWSM